MSFTDDIEADVEAVFLDVDNGFAVTASSDGEVVLGIFFNPYYEAGAGVSVGVESASPVLKVSQTQSSSLPQGSSLLIEGKNYRVVEPQPDGAGMIDLRLQLA